MNDNNEWRLIINDHSKISIELPNELDYIEIRNNTTGISQLGYFTTDGRHFFIRFDSEVATPTLIDSNYRWRFAKKEA